MARYEPRGIWQKVLSGLSDREGWLGKKAQKKLRRAYMARAMESFEAIEKELGLHDTCIDLGANYGDYTRRLAETGAVVHAFEPDPQTFEILKENVGGLSNVVLHQVAVAQTSGTMNLYRIQEDLASTAEKRSWGASLVPSQRSSRSDVVEVEVRSFEQVLAEIGKPVKLVKMDIEGAEVEILYKILAAPELYAAENLFVETHERQRPEQLADVMRLRSAFGGLSRPDVHLYWP